MPGNALAGGRGSLATDRPNKTVGSYWPYATTLFDYINRAMPYGNEKLLSANEVYGVSAYVLFLNGILDDDESLDANALRAVVMPNREGFQNVYSVKSSD
jgi:cytochrome c